MPSPVQSNCDAHDTNANGQYGAVWSMGRTQQLKEDANSDTGFVGRYCGSTLPTAITTTGNKLYITFHSDGKNNRAGFKLRFYTIDSPCGPTSLFAEAEPKSVTTPSYPLQYPINLRCKWIVYRNSSGRAMVQLTIKDLGINCSGDYVEVQKMRSQINGRRYFDSQFRNPVRLCGSVPVHDIFAVNSMSLYFHSDSINNSGRGFFFTYQEASCNRTYTASTAVVTNLAYPGRFNAVKDCAKSITTIPGRTISLYFSRLEIYDPTPGCVNSYMKVYDGTNTSAPLLGTFCGFHEPDPVYSTGRSLYVVTKMQHSSGSYYFIYVTADRAGLILVPALKQGERGKSEFVFKFSHDALLPRFIYSKMAAVIDCSRRSPKEIRALINIWGNQQKFDVTV
ncbi:cubilin [Trichonephila clavipes]|nr:cubilin [Trichonephila clavipes]